MRHYTEYDMSKQLHEDSLLCFDIETTSYFLCSGEIQTYLIKNKCDDYCDELNKAEKGAIVYLWSLSIDGDIFYGRDIVDFISFYKKLVERNQYRKLTFWVHNLAFEFQFLREYMNITDMFARNERKPMKFTDNPVSNISVEWRCTYMLTRLSLENWGNKIGIKKKVGQLDYNKLRTPLTPVTKKELEYSEYDVKIMHHGLSEFLYKYDTVAKIPLTQTGEVRNVIKEIFKQDMSYKRNITALQPKTHNEYNILKAAFSGGDTHANSNNAGRILHNVGSHDLTSDYPSQMCKQKFPMTRFKNCTPDLSTMDTDRYAYIIMIVFTDVKSKTPCRYLARSRCTSITKGTYDNGRLINADRVVCCITEQDYSIIKQTYDIGTEKVVRMMKSQKRYLPKKFIEFILELYYNKTALKDVVGSESLYAQAKQFINSLFGMCVTDLLQPDIKYDNIKSWYSAAVDVQKTLDEIQKKFYKNTLAYQWGVWITAYARRELWHAILATGDDCVYYDTDSCKILNYDKYTAFFANRDKLTVEMLRNMCKQHGIDFNKTRPKNPKGKICQLGVWDFEGVYIDFITLGAKRYAYRQYDKINSKNMIKRAAGREYRTPANCTITRSAYRFKKQITTHITVAGVPKRAADCLRGTLENFYDGFEFDRDDCGKKLLYYIDGCNLQCTMPDGYVVTQKNSVCMRNNGYVMGLTDEFKSLIGLKKRGNL